MLDCSAIILTQSAHTPWSIRAAHIRRQAATRAVVREQLWGHIATEAPSFAPALLPAQHVPRHQDPAVFVELVTEEVEE